MNTSKKKIAIPINNVAIPPKIKLRWNIETGLINSHANVPITNAKSNDNEEQNKGDKHNKCLLGHKNPYM